MKPTYPIEPTREQREMSVARRSMAAQGRGIAPPMDNSHGLPFCVFQFSATQAKPCYGRAHYYAETDEGDIVQTCEGHCLCSLQHSEDKLMAAYIPEGE